MGNLFFFENYFLATKIITSKCILDIYVIYIYIIWCYLSITYFSLHRINKKKKKSQRIQLVEDLGLAPVPITLVVQID